MTALPAPVDDYVARVNACLRGLGVPSDVISRRSLPLQMEADELEVVEIGDEGRQHRLIPPAARAWRQLQSAAAADHITLTIVSAFRSIDRQAEIVGGKLAAGLSYDAIFCASAPPGYSEHHTGRAVDITTPGARALEAEFDATPAFAWLAANAAPYGFFLSFPRGNRYGFIYEPWHWCFAPTGA